MLGWKHGEPLILGVAQPPPLFASPAWDGGVFDDACLHVAEETSALVAAGVDGVIVQNLWDGPVAAPAAPHTIAAMTALVRAARSVCPGPLGVCLDVNDGPAALAVAAAGGADFIRIKVLVGVMIKSSGLITGCAAELAAARRLPGMPRVAVLADVHDRSGTPLGDVPLLDDVEGALWSGADALIITGRSTESSVRMLKEVRPVVGNTPVLIGGGTNPQNVAEILPLTDGVVVGAYVKTDGVESDRVDVHRARTYVTAARATGAASA